MEINEKTKVNLFAVLVAVPCVATWIWYMASIQHEAADAKVIGQTAQQMAQENRAHYEQTNGRLLEKVEVIDERTIRIEETLKHIIKGE